MKGLHGIIFCYRQRAELRELVAERSSSSIPFASRYRAIDFALSNLINAGCSDVGVLLHGRYQSLLDHLGSGKDWDLSRKHGGLRLLPPFGYEGPGGMQPFRGKMEALANVRSYIDAIRQDYVALMDGDMVVNLPLQEILDQHIDSGADITVVCGNDSFATPDGSYFDVDADGKVTEVYYNLRHPRGYRGLEIYLLSTELLKRLTEEAAARDLVSFRRDVLRPQLGALNIRAFIWNGFAAQIHSVEEYYAHSMQLLTPEVRRELFPADRPVRAKPADKSSTYIGDEGRVLNSMIADGCHIEGTVEDSILFAGVNVGPGAVVRGCILFKEASVGANARLTDVIADKNTSIGEGVILRGAVKHPYVLPKGETI